MNVNYRYVDQELAYLLDNSDAAAIVYHDEFAGTVANAVAARTLDQPIARYQVAHDGDGVLAAGVRDYDDGRRAASSTGRGRRRTYRAATTSSSSTPAAPPARRRP